MVDAHYVKSMFSKQDYIIHFSRRHLGYLRMSHHIHNTRYPPHHKAAPAAAIRAIPTRLRDVLEILGASSPGAEHLPPLVQVVPVGQQPQSEQQNSELSQVPESLQHTSVVGS